MLTPNIPAHFTFSENTDIILSVSSEGTEKMRPVLYMVIPCFNEEDVLNITAPMFLGKLTSLTEKGKISADSRILFVDDGSRDGTWEIIKELSRKSPFISGISLSRNKGHQNALLAGLTEAADKCDITVSIDCDGQDDIDAVDRMIDEYLNGSEIVYGVRSSRKTDSILKRGTARLFYKLMSFMGVETVYDHADYRLVSSKVLKSFSDFKEVNIFLRGMFPLVGFRSTSVYYERRERLGGKSKYSPAKMLALALDGITSLSVKPIRIITLFGCVVALLSFVGILWSVIVQLTGNSVAGWASLTSILCFLGGVQLISLGIIGEYIGKIYLETKNRPRFIIAEKTEDEKK